jgi:hypothetical protein
VAIFVLTSILKELQWQIRIISDQTVDQSAVAVVVLVVRVARIRVVVLVAALAVHVVTIVTRNQLVLLGKNALPTTQIRLIQSQRPHQFLTKLLRTTYQHLCVCS